MAELNRPTREQGSAVMGRDADAFSSRSIENRRDANGILSPQSALRYGSHKPGLDTSLIRESLLTATKTLGQKPQGLGF